MIHRDDFCKLTELTVETVKSRSKRLQMPFLTEIQRTYRGYSYFDVLQVLLVEELMDGAIEFSLSNASKIIRYVAPKIAEEWSEVGPQAKNTNRIIWFAQWNGKGEWRSFVGDVLAASTSTDPSKYPHLISGSLSDCCTRLQERAKAHRLTIPISFWSETPRGFEISNGSKVKPPRKRKAR